jgi:erythromycin esterase-like protein
VVEQLNTLLAERLDPLIKDDEGFFSAIQNARVVRAAAIRMGWEGEFNIGQLCRMAYGRDAVLLGMGTDRGSVAAADDWDAPMKIKQVVPALVGSWEREFLQAGVRASLTDWRTAPDEALLDALSEPLLERAIGVIYRPETERQSHYFEAVLAEQFDAWLWFEQTEAVTPLPTPHTQEHEEDTFPFGL